MSDQELKWPAAIYYDTHGIRRNINSAELYDSEALAKSRALATEKKLYDKSGLIHLTPVTPKNDAYHFRQIGEERYAVLNMDGGTLHDKRVDELETILNSYDHWRFGTSIWDTKYSQPEFSPIIDLDCYRWQSETVRSFKRDSYVRHDVFGQSNRLSTSKFHPWIAIEVIDTHFPTEETYQVFLAATTNTPFIICFDFIGYGDYFFRTGHEYLGRYLPITSLMYMKDGVLWYGGKTNVLKTARDFFDFSKFKLDKLRSRVR